MTCVKQSFWERHRIDTFVTRFNGELMLRQVTDLHFKSLLIVTETSSFEF